MLERSYISDFISMVETRGQIKGFLLTQGGDGVNLGGSWYAISYV